MTLRLRAIRLALVLSILPSTAAAGAWVLQPGDWSTEIRGTFFNADTYRDVDGNRTPLPGGAVMEQHSMSAWNEFGWKKRASVFFAVPFVSTSLRFADDSQLPTQTVFGDLVAGARYALKAGATAVSLQAVWKAPMGYNRQLPPAPGDGQQDIAGTLALGSAVGGNGFIEIEGGYNYRFEAPADQILGSATAGWWFGSLLIGGHYAGAAAAGDGETPTDKISEQLVGPMVVYRVDDHIDLVAGSMHTAAGENTLHADRVYVALSVKQSSLNRLQGLLGNSRRP